MREFIFIIVMSLFTLISNAETKKILILDAQSQEPYKTMRENLIKELKKNGYEIGKNLIVDSEIVGNFEGRAYNILKAEADKYDLIFINGTVAAQGAVEFINKKENKYKYSFVFGNITDPEGLGLVEKIGRVSQTRFTGVAYPVDVEERLRFIMKIFGNNIKIGYIYADMPQSKAYNKWLDEALKKKEFKNIKLISRKIEFVKGNEGHKRMVQLAKKSVIEIDKNVDVFMSANDQMGISDEFSIMVNKTATKPLIGLANEKGSTVAIASDIEKNSKKAAEMIKMIFEGAKVNEIISQKSETKIYYDKVLVEKFKIDIKKINKKSTGGN